MPKAPKIIPLGFDKNIFINCPFDDKYLPLFRAIIFTVHDIGFTARCALQESNAGDVRIDKIQNIIAECKYSIHDLSRTQLDKVHRLPRFNMPLELGLDLGCKRFGVAHQQEKVVLVMDVERYRYQRFISDISGQDVHEHGGTQRGIINVVRDWLMLELDPRKVVIPSGEEILTRFGKFKRALPSICLRLHWNPADWDSSSMLMLLHVGSRRILPEANAAKSASKQVGP
jgi:hypothetical protein